jgi:hypothetical protein
MGDGVVVATLTTDNDTVLRVATAAQHRSGLLGPFTPGIEPAELQE